MKKFLVSLLLMAMCFSLVACGGNSATTENENGDTETAVEEASEEKGVLKTDVVEIEGICVDDSYTAEDGSPLKIVYLFYNLNAGDSNLEIDSKYTTMTINDTNSYESEILSKSAAKFMPSYLYSGYINDVYVGSTQKVLATFQIPEGDLTEGKTITLTDTQIPTIEELSFTTDVVKHFASADELAQAMDSEGYAKMMDMRNPADEARTAEVKGLINGYYWDFYVNKTSYQIEFWADNNFELRTAFGTNGGTYTVQNGYVFCTYSSNGYVVEIPYTIENGKIDLDFTEAFDVN